MSATNPKTATSSSIPLHPLLGRRVRNAVGEVGRVVAVATDGRDLCSVKWEDPARPGSWLPGDTLSLLSRLLLIE